MGCAFIIVFPCLVIIKLSQDIFDSLRMPGKMFNNELYVLGVGTNSRVYNFEQNQWRTMSNDPMPSSPINSPCMVIWKDSFITFGGLGAETIVQAYNITTKVIKI